MEMIDKAFYALASEDKVGFMDAIEVEFYNQLGDNEDYNNFKETTAFYRDVEKEGGDA